MSSFAENRSLLPSEPTGHPHCCLSISRGLIDLLGRTLPPGPAITLSIGSGTGLLESLLAECNPHVRVEGVEAESSINEYIPEQNMHTVAGTWDLCSAAEEAEAWLFVYPKETKLVRKYLREYGNKEVLKTIVWLGPRSDWQDYNPILKDFGNLEVYTGGNIVAEYETMAVLKKG